jgi:3-oxoacyl-[acyl-carrier protein] reductase
MSFEGKIAIVTGAAQGIGEGYARDFALHGMKIIVADQNEEKGTLVAKSIIDNGGSAIFVKTDIADEDSCKNCADTAAETYGGVDYLINNAGIFAGMRMEGYLTIDIEYLTHFTRVNAHGLILMTRAVLPHMKKRGGGVIINQSSTASWMFGGPYGDAKLLVNSITCQFAKELGQRGIRVNAVAPGPVDTAATREMAGDYTDQLVNDMPISRLGTPDDMAKAVRFLLSDDASWITGVILDVDGGQLMRL